MTAELRTQYKEKAVPEMMKRFAYKNRHQAPHLVKVVVNVGYGKHAKEKPFIDHVEKTLTLITGQKPVHNKSRKAISNFKTRVGMPIGASVTLRGNGMYEFLYKLIHLTLPRVRDFRGLNPKAGDGHGNYTIGIKEQLAFPEIGQNMSDIIHGLEVVVVTSAKNHVEGLALLELLGFPFKKE